jgi:hypothetical protein
MKQTLIKTLTTIAINLDNLSKSHSGLSRDATNDHDRELHNELAKYYESIAIDTMDQIIKLREAQKNEISKKLGE